MYWHSQAIAWLLEAKVLMNIQGNPKIRRAQPKTTDLVTLVPRSTRSIKNIKGE